MKHYAITLPENDELGEAIVNALLRGVHAGKVLPHTPNGTVLRSGSVVEFDTDDPVLAQIIETTRQEEPEGFAVTVSEHEPVAAVANN